MIAKPMVMDVPLYTDEHGKIRVGRTRVLLELVIHAYHQGETAEGIIESYPSLNLGDVYAVLAYYLAHRVEVDAYVNQADANTERIQQEVEANYPQETLALRARLRAIRDERRHTGS